MEELEAKVDSEEYDTVVVSETWFKEESHRGQGWKATRCIGVIGRRK